MPSPGWWRSIFLRWCCKQSSLYCYSHLTTVEERGGRWEQEVEVEWHCLETATLWLQVPVIVGRAWVLFHWQHFRGDLLGCTRDHTVSPREPWFCLQFSGCLDETRQCRSLRLNINRGEILTVGGSSLCAPWGHCLSIRRLEKLLKWQFVLVLTTPWRQGRVVLVQINREDKFLSRGVFGLVTLLKV